MNQITQNRVPHIIILYWVIKIASTTLGETGADLFSHTLNMGYLTTIIIFMSIFIFFLVLKLSIKKYNPTIYWLTFTSTAIVGTAISDFLDRTLGLGYLVGSSLLIVSLSLILILWYRKEHSIAVDNIYTFHAEFYYWLAFLVANTLGTALGDYIADDVGLGFFNSSILIGGILIFIAILHYSTKISSILLFWLAFVLTRPFGASFGDLLTKTQAEGGLDLGTMGASLVFSIILFFAIIYETKLENKRNIT